MTVWLAAQAPAHPHIRPFEPQRDLAQLADLVEVAFGPELALTESRVVHDMRQVAQWGPLLWATQGLMQLFTGYVWIEDGELVGNVSLSREKQPATWMISNVAVLPEYRGRGIAGQLVDRAIEHARQANARRILLQVRASNEVAIALYRHRGFVTFDTLHELRLSAANWPLLLGSPDERLRSVRCRDGAALERLIRESTPVAVLRHKPLRRADYRRGPLWWLGQQVTLLMGGKLTLELVGDEDGLAAYGALAVQLLRGQSELTLHVRPAARGRWELPLVEGLFHAANRLPRQTIRAYLSTSHPEALEALDGYGFRTLRILDQMALEFG